MCLEVQLQATDKLAVCSLTCFLKNFLSLDVCRTGATRWGWKIKNSARIADPAFDKLISIHFLFGIEIVTRLLISVRCYWQCSIGFFSSTSDT